MSECRKQQLAASKTYTLTIPISCELRTEQCSKYQPVLCFNLFSVIIIIIYFTRKVSGLSRNGPQAWLPFHSYSRLHDKKRVVCVWEGYGTAITKRPIIARFTCRMELDYLWRQRNVPKEADAKIRLLEDLLRSVPDLRGTFLVSALRRTLNATRRQLLGIDSSQRKKVFAR